MNVLFYINLAITVLFTVMYFYQYIYLAIGFCKKPVQFPEGKKHRYAVLIAGRNEQAVIGHLIRSLRAQDYPADKLDIYVVADNCTDETARVAAIAGATVYERFDTTRVGKGYALTYLFARIWEVVEDDYYDGYFIFDADNLLEPDYVNQMDRVFSAGYPVVTSRRNSKNYGDNWISAGYAQWFLREAVHLNHPRMTLGTSCAVSGTGFLFSADIARRNGGWKHYLLTEDIEFTIDCILHGQRIGYCHEAVFYDEQPTTFRQSWRQRLRWAKGYLQVFRHYGLKMLRGAVLGVKGPHKNRFACFDMAVTLMPALILSVVGLCCNMLFAVLAAATGGTALLEVAKAAGTFLLSGYGMLFIVGLGALIHQWRDIRCPAWKKVVYQLTFPLFIMTYLPITFCAFFQKVEWKPIEHKVAISYDQCTGQRSSRAPTSKRIAPHIMAR